MLYNFTVRLPHSIYEELKKESKETGATISEIVRDSLSARNRSLKDKSYLSEIMQQLESLKNRPSQDGSNVKESNQDYLPYLAEITYLLREIADSNPQVLIKANNELSKKYGKDRKRL